MRRLIFAIALIAAISLSAGLAILYVMRDQLFLREARIQAEKLAPLHVDLGTLRTTLLGTFSIELGELEVRQDKGSTVKLRSLRVESTLGLAGLYRAYRAGEEIPLSVSAAGLRATLPPAAPATGTAVGAAMPTPWPTALPVPAASPVPVRVALSLKGGEISGAAVARELQLKGNLRLRPSGLEGTLSAGASIGLGGGDALLPVSFDAKLAAGPEAVKVQSFALRAAGLEGTGSGELALRPVKGNFRLALDAPDLARVALRPEDRAAVGLTGQPAGAVHLTLDGAADETGRVAAAGALRLDGLLLPLRAPEKTAYSALLAGQHVDGPVSLHADVPFRLTLLWPAGLAAPRFSISNAKLGFDLTQASVVSKDKLEKPRGVPLRGELTVSSSDSGVELPSFSLGFHALSLTGSAAAPAPIGSRLDAGFRLQISSLAGFPALLPMLRQAEAGGAAITDAQGAIQAEGSVRLLPAAPSRSLVDLKTLSVRGLRLPLAYSGESASARGVLTGSASGGGRYDAGDVNVSRTNGSFDLTGLELTSNGKFAKKRGRKLLVAFDAQGSPSRLQIRNASLVADGLSAAVAGTAAFDRNRNAALNLSVSSHADLGPLREYLPKLPAKISGGTFDANAKIGGTWLPAGGLEKSPLAISGKLTAKLGSVVMPEPPHSAEKGAPPSAGPLLPDWPAVRHAELAFHAELAQFQRGSLAASGIALVGTFKQGSFSANASVARAFGGKASLKNLSGSLVSPKLAVRGAAAVEGLDLSQAAAFVDPSYGKIVKGTLKADSTFAVPDVWSEQLLEQASAAGQAQVHNGYLSTASFDGLVNEKLKSIPGLGDKAKVSTGGLSAEIRTAFQVAGGTATLSNFVAATPKKDEMRLAGTMNLAFDCDLSGTAHLASAPVTGPVREANSDPEGRLVVPVRFHGNLKAPQADVATGAIQEMLKKTAVHELDKRKNQAIDAAKQKAQQGLQDAAGGLLDQLKKGL